MFRHYFRILIKNLLGNRLHTIINISGLALGFACCIVLTLFILGEIGYDSYHENKENLYRLTLEVEQLNDGSVYKDARSSFLWAPAMFRDFPEIESFVRIYEEVNTAYKFNDVEFQERRAVYADENVFSFFTWSLLQGDPETALSQPYSAVINETLARRFFGDSDPIGQILFKDELLGDSAGSPDWDKQFVVTGVMEDIPYKSHLKPAILLSFRTLNDFFNADVTAGATADPGSWRGRFVHTYLGLGRNASADVLEMKFPDFLDRYLGDSTRTRGYEYHPYLQRLDTIHLEGPVSAVLERGGNKTQLAILSMIALAILAVACINFTNLSVAQSSIRSREIGIRKAAGAQRSQLVLQFLGESVLLAIASLILALAIAELINPIFYSYIERDFFLSPSDLPLIIATLLSITVLAGLISGLYPSIFMAGFKPSLVLKNRFAISGKGRYLGKILVVMQFAITVFFIFATLTVYTQIRFMKNYDLGVKMDGILVLPPTVTQPLMGRLETIRTELLNYSGVRGITISNGVPGGGGGGDIWGQQGGPDNLVLSTNEMSVDYDFLDLYGLELLAGRKFDRNIITDAAPAEISGPGYEMAGIINETAVRRFGWRTPEEALGKRITRDPVSNDYSVTVIGVVKAFHTDSLENEIEPLILYISPHVQPAYRVISVELNPQNTSATIDYIRQVVEPYLGDAAFDYVFVDDNFDLQYDDEQRMTEIIAYVAFLTILLAGMGLFGLASFAAVRRTKEIGIRKVLGATVESVVRLISGDFVKLVALSSLLAFPVSYHVMSEWLEGFAYRIELGPRLFVLSGLLALTIAIVTVSSQTIKAALQSPVNSLRHE